MMVKKRTKPFQLGVSKIYSISKVILCCFSDSQGRMKYDLKNSVHPVKDIGNAISCQNVFEKKALGRFSFLQKRRKR